MTTRNPPWIRDELIIALDLYFRSGRKVLDDHDERIKQTSKILRNIPINRKWSNLSDFRNKNSVCLKLANFRSLDPQNTGKGLQNIGNLDKQIWNEFSNNPIYLRSIAQTIIDSVNTPKLFDEDSIEVNYGFIEGKTIERMHKFYERNTKLVEKKKELAQQAGELNCYICGFDFYKIYGETGRGYIECHHIRPLSEYPLIRKTTLDDLVLVCSNCHRMLHRQRPWLSKKKLKTILKI